MPSSLTSKSILLDKEGFLKQLSDWNSETATLLASNENISLTEEHWEIIHLVRDYYQEFEISPAMRPLVKYTAQQLGKKKGNSIYLLSLFPGSPAKLISKIAGLPKPDNCL
jgi:tRNA 2-thiouridine synthesizing protein E